MRRAVKKRLIEECKLAQVQSVELHSTQRQILSCSYLEARQGVLINTIESLGKCVHSLMDLKTTTIVNHVELPTGPSDYSLAFRDDLMIMFGQSRRIGFVWKDNREIKVELARGEYFHSGLGGATTERDVFIEGYFLYYPCYYPKTISHAAMILCKFDLREIARTLPHSWSQTVIINCEKYIYPDICMFERYLLTDKYLYTMWECGVMERYDKATLQRDRVRTPQPRPPVPVFFNCVRAVDQRYLLVGGYYKEKGFVVKKRFDKGSTGSGGSDRVCGVAFQLISSVMNQKDLLLIPIRGITNDNTFESLHICPKKSRASPQLIICPLRHSHIFLISSSTAKSALIINKSI